MKILSPILVGASMAFALPAFAWADGAASVTTGHHARAPMQRLLSHLDLSPDQQARVKAIHESLRPRAQALHATARHDRDALAATPPTDPGYASLVDESKAAATQAIQLRADAWAQVYAVLTPEQRAKVPLLAAEAQRRRDERHRAWAAEGQSGPT